MEIKAKARYIKMSPRKVRLVVDMVRGKKVAAALNILEFCNRWAARPVLKLLNSAVANATHNFNLQKDNLYIKTIRVDQGTMLKRWRARAFGRAAEIQKKMSHIIIELDEIKKDEAAMVKSAKILKTEVVKKVKSPKSKVQSKGGALRQNKNSVKK